MCSSDLLKSAQADFDIRLDSYDARRYRACISGGGHFPGLGLRQTWLRSLYRRFLTTALPWKITVSWTPSDLYSRLLPFLLLI